MAAVALAIWLALAGAETGPQAFVSSVAAPVIDVVAAIFVLRAARSAAPGRVRIAWTLLAVGMIVYAVGDGLWAWITEVQGADAFPSPADLAYVAFYPIAAAALVLFPSPSIARRELIRLAVDTSIVIVGGGMVVWHSLIAPLLSSADTDPVSRGLTFAYPIGDLVLLFAVATIALRRPVGIAPRALVALVAGLGLMFVADMAYGELVLADTPDQWWIDGAYLGSSLAIALGGYLQAQSDEAAEHEEAPPVSGLLLLLPYAGLAAGFAVLVASANASGGGHVTQLVAAAIGLTVLVLIRQEIINRENAALLASAARREAEAHYQSLEGQASDTLILVDGDGRVAYASPSLERVIDVDRTGLLGRNVTDLAHAEDIAALSKLIADTAAGNPVTPLEWRIWTRAGAWRQVETIPANMLGDAAVGKIVLTTRDVGERRALRQQVAQAALRDALTGIPNRVLFEDRTKQAIVAAHRSGAAVAVVVLDLKGFSRINASFGHAAGDRVLREVARRLTASVRAADSVARLGGDAFGVLVSGTGSVAEAQEVAERFRVALQVPMTEGSTTFELAASFGIATTDGAPDIDADQLLRDADVAETVAHDTGQDRAVVYEASMQRTLEGAFELEADLRHAVAENQLVLQYQPIVDLATRGLVGAEALVRWEHPVRGRLAPAEFIPLAEQAGLIGEIGLWVLRQACRDVTTWAQVAPGRVPRVSVNLAAPQVTDPQLPWIVHSTLAEAGAAPGWLTLEVTESILVTDTLDTLERLHALRALGVKISVDDFGTGYSSLAYLQRFPVNHIKIDRSFVTPLETDDGLGLVPAIIEIGRALGMSTIAEGIETERQLERLQRLGCDFGQGYLFDRPLDAAVMLERVRGTVTTPRMETQTVRGRRGRRRAPVGARP